MRRRLPGPRRRQLDRRHQHRRRLLPSPAPGPVPRCCPCQRCCCWLTFSPSPGEAWQALAQLWLALPASAEPCAALLPTRPASATATRRHLSLIRLLDRPVLLRCNCPDAQRPRSLLLGLDSQYATLSHGWPAAPLGAGGPRASLARRVHGAVARAAGLCQPGRTAGSCSAGWASAWRTLPARHQGCAHARDPGISGPPGCSPTGASAHHADAAQPRQRRGRARSPCAR